MAVTLTDCVPVQAGQALNLQLNFHGDEINPMAAGELAGELSALAVSHLERVWQPQKAIVAERERERW
jgi:hypothetical protein